MAIVGSSLHDAGGSGSTVFSASVAEAVESPAFVVDERVVLAKLGTAARLRERTGCKVLYTLKPLACAFLLELMRPWVDGFAASSLFEARLARSAIRNAGTVHLTTPGLRAAELPELTALCDTIAFNSLSQLRRLAAGLGESSRAGLRINPRLSLVDDVRYDPCRPQSKLGVPIGQVRKALDDEPRLLDGLRGLHFHTNRASDDFRALLATVKRIEKRLRDWLPRLEWINLGGGYGLDPAAEPGPFDEAVERLKGRYGLEVFVEPGTAFIRQAGFLVTEVIDLFRSGGKEVAVLDTTVNHWPELFEYQLAPAVLGHVDGGKHEYVLAGCSCLAGDLLGEYSFGAPLRIGSRLVLPDCGAYSQVKAHMFNGINLPTIYSVTQEGGLILRRRYTYDDFSSRTGLPTDAPT